MAYDEVLAQRVRELVAGETAVSEKRMFAGLSFLLNGNMAVGIHQDRIIVRIDPADAEAALSRPGVHVFDLTGRPMKGWITVDASTLDEDTALAGWVHQGLAFAATLPPK